MARLSTRQHWSRFNARQYVRAAQKKAEVVNYFGFESILHKRAFWLLFSILQPSCLL